MENENTNTSKGKRWLISAIILLCALLVAQVIYWMSINSALGLKIRSLEDKIAALNKQNDELKRQIPAKQNTIPAANKITYENSEYGFGLQFPLTWKNYRWAKRTVGWGSFGTSPSYDFGFAEQDSIFNIGVLTHSQWNSISNSQEGERPTYLGENSEHVFTYMMSQYSANDFTTARRNEVQNIISTFTVK